MWWVNSFSSNGHDDLNSYTRRRSWVEGRRLGISIVNITENTINIGTIKFFINVYVHRHSLHEFKKKTRSIFTVVTHIFSRP